MTEQIYRQRRQKAQGILCVLPSIFGVDGGKWAGQVPSFDGIWVSIITRRNLECKCVI